MDRRQPSVTVSSSTVPEYTYCHNSYKPGYRYAGRYRTFRSSSCRAKAKYRHTNRWHKKPTAILQSNSFPEK